MSTLGERIQSARKRKKLKQTELSKLMAEHGLKVSNSVISNWEKDVTMPDINQMIGLCEILDIGLDYLIDYYGGNSIPITPDDQDRIRRFHALDTDGQTLVDTVLTHEYNRCNRRQVVMDLDVCRKPFFSLAVSAGTGEDWSADNAEELITIPRTKAAERADYIIPVHGDSMEPEYEDGDLILVESMPEVQPGQLGVFAVNGSMYFKVLGKNRDELRSLNEEKYEPIKLQDSDETITYGRVLGKTHRVQ